MLYAYAQKNKLKNVMLYTGVIPLKNFDNQFLAVCQKQGRIKEPLLIDSNVLKDYEKALFKLLIEIFNPKTTFDQIEDKG
jgi:hypothetical protein